MAEEAPNAALSGNRKTSMLSRISQGAAVIVQGPHGKKMERAATRVHYLILIWKFANSGALSYGEEGY